MRLAAHDAAALTTGFLPQTPLFDILVADPRAPVTGTSYQSYLDDDEFDNIGAVNFGGSLPIYGWRIGDGTWQVGLEGGVFSIFDLDGASSDLRELRLPRRAAARDALRRLQRARPLLPSELASRRRVPAALRGRARQPLLRGRRPAAGLRLLRCAAALWRRRQPAAPQPERARALQRPGRRRAQEPDAGPDLVHLPTRRGRPAGARRRPTGTPTSRRAPASSCATAFWPATACSCSPSTTTAARRTASSSARRSSTRASASASCSRV